MTDWATLDGATGADLALRLPSGGPEPMPFDTALAAVLGYARARRPLLFHHVTSSQGRWVHLPAYGWSRFDTQPVDPSGARDILVAEGLHKRLDRSGWTAVDLAVSQVRPAADAAVARAGGRALWELPDDELSLLGGRDAVGALLREIGRSSGQYSAHVLAVLHHRHPTLIPHLTPTTRRALLPHLAEGDTDVDAVVRREVQANETGFAALESAIARLTGDATPSRLRLHDILLWLTATLRLAHAVEAGCAADEWTSHTPR